MASNRNRYSKTGRNTNSSNSTNSDLIVDGLNDSGKYETSFIIDVFSMF